MEFFDTATLLLAFALVGLLVTPWATIPWLKSLSLALAVCVVLHLTFEGLRWQMVPAFVVVTATFLFADLRLRRREHVKARSLNARIGGWFGAGIAVVLLALTVLLSYAFPIFDMPAPTGGHPVGTMELHVIDENRAESHTDDATDHRELMVRIWYPAESITGRVRAMYWRQSGARSAAVTSSTPLPWFTFTHLRLIPTHSYWRAPMAHRQPSYPVVLYSHGIGLGWASANTTLAEGLASHGYVVVGINHAFIGSISIFPDGRIARFDEATARAMNRPPPPEAVDLQAKIGASKDWREQVVLYSKGMKLMSGALEKVTRALDTQVADQQFVISQLERLQRGQNEQWATRLNLERIGVIGMSLGGSAALETCSIDSRCKAGVNLDGFHPRHIGLALQDTPFLFMNRDDNLLYNTNFQSSLSPVYSARISGVTHFNFFDFSIMSPLYKRLGVLGPIDGHRMLRLTEDYVLAFFDKHLRDRSDVDLALLSETYPEVEFAQRNQ
jgi:predicted dienelactone hydrolase